MAGCMPSVPYRTGNMRWWLVPEAQCRWNRDMGRQRQIDVRSLVIVLALLAAGLARFAGPRRQPDVGLEPGPVAEPVRAVPCLSLAECCAGDTVNVSPAQHPGECHGRL